MLLINENTIDAKNDVLEIRDEKQEIIKNKLKLFKFRIQRFHRFIVAPY